MSYTLTDLGDEELYGRVFEIDAPGHAIVYVMAPRWYNELENPDELSLAVTKCRQLAERLMAHLAADPPPSIGVWDEDHWTVPPVRPGHTPP